MSRCLSNILKSNKGFVFAAIETTGQPVTWRDEPDETMATYPRRDEFGSVWTDANVDLSLFWAAYRRLSSQEV